MDDAETLYSCKEQEDADDALSLSSFPLHADNDSTNSQSLSDPRRSLAESKEADLFEFLIDVDLINSSADIMCSADDVIINGKLLPCKLPLQTRSAAASVRLQQEEESNIRNPVAVSDSPTKQELCRKTTKSSGGGGFDKAVDVLRKNNAALRPRPRPKWQLLGLTKFPTEMELRDIRTRQLRRRQTHMTNNGDDEKMADRMQVVRRQCGWIGSWKLLNSLSCKKHDAASAVVASACCPPLSSADPTEIH